VSQRGSLVVVGVGIGGLQQVTAEAAAYMEAADQLFYLIVDPVTELWVRSLNATAGSLHDLYGPHKPRSRTYREMSARITRPVFEGKRVCVAFYGHPGVLVNPARQAIRAVRRAGFTARLVPGISAEACLYADLDLDPGTHGVQSFEATDFLLYRRRIDPTSALILWQIGVLGDTRNRDPGEPYRADRMNVLVRRLQRQYPRTHRVVIYAASTFPTLPPGITRVPLQALARTAIGPMTTLYVPAVRQRGPDPRIARWVLS
jgi:uncharacterized protein YabN with tetrapyrrole methylase and pyrophosphatase domain